jgi:hypothetical protein
MNNSSKIKLTNENGAEKTYGQIPDLWHHAEFIGKHFGDEQRDAILEVWGMAHDLKACAEQQQGNGKVPAHITEVRGVSHGRLSQLDAICRKNTAFRSFFALCDAKGDYLPSISMDESWGEILAIAYDTFQERHGDGRRAFRYGAK